MSPFNLPKIKVAACNVAPVFMDTAKTVAKCIALIEETAANGANLVVFSETFIPGFPVWAGISSPNDCHDLFYLLADQSIYVDGAEIAQIASACRENKIFASVGFNEKSHSSVGCLWNSYVLISDEGVILNHHRKIVPTFFEKLIWANGDGAGLKVVDTKIGKVGGLICGENGNPLAKYSLMAQGVQLNFCTWPAFTPGVAPNPSGEGHKFDLAHAIRVRAQALSFEAKCFNIVCSGYKDKAMRDFLVARDPGHTIEVDNGFDGITCFFDPKGVQIGEEIQGREGVAYCDMDLSECVGPKQMHDFVGGYNRYDIFNLTVNRTRHGPATFA